MYNQWTTRWEGWKWGHCKQHELEDCGSVTEAKLYSWGWIHMAESTWQPLSVIASTVLWCTPFSVSNVVSKLCHQQKPNISNWYVKQIRSLSVYSLHDNTIWIRSVLWVSMWDSEWHSVQSNCGMKHEITWSYCTQTQHFSSSLIHTRTLGGRGDPWNKVSEASMC